MIVPLTPLDFFKRTLRIYPDKTAVVDGDLRLSYRAFAERVYRLGHALHRLGTASGERVAVLSPNTHEMLESFYGAPLIGAALVPLNYRLKPGDFLYMLNHSESKVLLLDAEYAPLIEPVSKELRTVEHILVWGDPRAGSLGQSYEEALQSASSEPLEPAIQDENQMMTLNYTSGTTALPKGVILTHRNCCLNVLETLVHFRMTPEEVYLWTLPMFHCNGWGFVWAVTAAGGTHICLRKVEAARVFEGMESEHVTLACAAPTVLVMLSQYSRAGGHKLNKRLRMGTAGSPPPAEVIKRMETLGIEIIHVYGLTETSPFLTWCEWQEPWNELPLEERARLKARQGVPQLCAGDVKVVNEESHEVAHDGRESGEVVARGNLVLAGYYKDSEATAQVFSGGWFHTGDLAVVEPDGYIRILDRTKDIIISGGENISSVEVESVLYQHPAVLEAAIVAQPHEQWGEVPKAFVVLHPGAQASEQEILDFCRQKLAHFKAPKSVEFLSELPKTATGKIQKFALREKEWKGLQARVH